MELKLLIPEPKVRQGEGSPNQMALSARLKKKRMIKRATSPLNPLPHLSQKISEKSQRVVSGQTKRFHLGNGEVG